MEDRFLIGRRFCIVMTMLLMLLFLAESTATVFAEPVAGTEQTENAEGTDADKETEKKEEENSDGEVTAEAVILVDLNSGITLFEKNPDKQMFPASTTKIMTALVALDAVKAGEVSLDSKFVLNQAAFDTLAPDGSSISLKVGEEMSLDNLLKGLLIASGNDAAVVIAEGIAGSIDGFVERMNQKAAELNLSGTHFVNPHGLHNEQHYTTARDLAVMTIEAMKYETFASIVECAHIYLDPTSMNDKRYFINTNNLVSRFRFPDYFYNYATGVKTGSTTEAGSCLVSSATKEDRSVICVLLKAKDTAASHVESKAFLEHGLDDFKHRKIAKADDIFGEVAVEQGADGIDHVILQAQSNVEVLFDVNGNVEDVEKVFEIPEYITAPVQAGQVIGKVSFVYNGQKLGETNLVARDNIERSWFGPIEGFFSWIWKFKFVRIIVWILSAVLGIFLLMLLVGFARAIKKSKRKSRRNSSYRPPKY